MVTFTTRNGEVLTGKLVHQYNAFEGGRRYVVAVNGKEYRCIRDEAGNYKEYVA